MPLEPATDRETNVSDEAPGTQSVCEQVEAYIEEQPVKAMLIAVLAGFFFSRIVL
jgi:hypothetical protein